MKKIRKITAVAIAAAILIISSILVLPISAEDGIITVPQWNSFRGNFSNNALTDSKTATTSDEAVLNWKYRLKNSDDWYTNISDPIIGNDSIYIAAGSQLIVLDMDGNCTAVADIENSVDYISRMIFVNDKIIVPITNGQVQAIDANTLETVWLTDALEPISEMSHQSQTTLSYDNGKIYFGTACADWTTSYAGVFGCIDEKTGETLWTFTNEDAGYYWSGSTHLGGKAYIAGDDGILRSFDGESGDVLLEIDLGAPVRSTVIKSGECIYVTTTDGTLHKLDMSSGQTPTKTQTVKFADSSTSTPAVYDGKIYVGAGYADYSGGLCVIDDASMKVVYSVSTPAPVQASPLISTGYSDEFVYFTCNTIPGEIYLYDEAKGDAEIIFTPEDEDKNYCMSSVIADKNGTLYYTNDSGNLFAVKSVITKPTDPKTPSSEIKTIRISGSSRIETANKIAAKGWKTAKTVVLASANSFPDAMAGGPLAYALDAPILLTNNGALEDSLISEIKSLNAEEIVILGGDAAVSQDIETALAEDYTVTRISGANRFETAVKIAKELLKTTNKDTFENIFIASGNNFPDALTVSPAAAISSEPILFAYGSANADLTLETTTAKYIKKIAPKNIAVIGGENSIGNNTIVQLENDCGVENVKRVAGQSRYDTAIEVYNEYKDIFSGNSVVISTGKNFPDALAGGSFAAKKSAPILIVDGTVNQDKINEIIKKSGAVNMYVLGGESAVSEVCVDALWK